MGFRNNIVFFLGAWDLEMSYIRDLLDYCCVEYHNKRLNQDNANVSSYDDGIKAAIANGKRLYFIELADADGAREAYDYDNIAVIDPHIDSHQKPSIVQVYDMLGYTITRHYQLIAAYDTNGIPGMVGMGATQEEIIDIQGEERVVKRITSNEQEAAHKKAISKRTWIGDLCVVRTEYHNCSTVVAILSTIKPDDIKNLLIISKFFRTVVVNYYGDSATRTRLKKVFPEGSDGYSEYDDPQIETSFSYKSKEGASAIEKKFLEVISDQSANNT